MMNNLLKILLSFLIVFSTLSSITNSPAAAKADNTLKAKVNVGSGKKLNVRSSKSTKNNKNIIGSLKNKTAVSVHVRNTKWSEIRYKKKKAYVATKHLKFSSSTKKWAGKYHHLASGTGSGTDLEVTNQTKNSFEFYISDYGREDSNGKWVYDTWELKGKASIKKGVGYYNKKGCKIVFDFTTKDAIYGKNAIFTDFGGSCKVGIGDESRKLPKDEKMGYVKY